MNERLKQLLEDATEIHDDWKTGTSHRVVSHKIFAELIVRECVSQCEKVADRADKMAKSKFVTPEGRLLNEGMWGGAKNCSALIKSHFGVE